MPGVDSFHPSADEVLKKVRPGLQRNEPLAPRASYRSQLDAGFTLDGSSTRNRPTSLSVKDVYASPLLRARAGSQHGYAPASHRLGALPLSADESHEGVAASRMTGLRVPSPRSAG